MLCPVCKGEKCLFIDGIKFTNLKCDFCYGKKDLDWIESIIGVSREKSFDDYLNNIYRRKYAK